MRRLLFAALLSLFALPCDAQSNLALPSIELPNFAAFAAGGAFGQYLHIQGSAKPGDGGGGYFYRSGLVCTPDGLTILKDKSGNCFFLQPGGTTPGSAYVASVAAMQAITSPSSAADVQTASFFVGLGKGGARYTWNAASTANDCLHIAVTGFPTGRYVLRTDLQGNQIQATQCGAYYDSSADGSTGHNDYTAQQSAFDAAYTYGLIVGPDFGITRVCGTINPNPGVVKKGAGPLAEVFQFACSAGAAGFYFQAPIGTTTYAGFQLSNFAVNGNPGQNLIQANCTGGSAPCGFTDDGTTQGYIDGVIIDHIFSPTTLNEAATYVQLSKCFHCVIRNSSFATAFGACIQGVGDDFLLIQQNKVIGCNISGGSHAIDVEGAGQFGNLDRIIQNDVLRTRGASDAYIYSSAKSVEIAGNAIEDGTGDPGVACNIKIDTGFQVSVHDNIPQANANAGDNYPICVYGDFWYSLDIYDNAIATGTTWGVNFNGSNSVAYYVPSAVPAMRNHVTHHNNTTESGFPMNTSGSGAVAPGDLIYDSTPDTFMGPTANNFGATVRVTSAGFNGSQSPAWIIPANAAQGNTLLFFTNPNLVAMNGTMSVCFKGIAGAASQQLSLELDDNGVSVATATVTMTAGGGGQIYCPASLAHIAIATNARVDVWNQDTVHGGAVYLAEVYIKNG